MTKLNKEKIKKTLGIIFFSTILVVAVLGFLFFLGLLGIGILQQYSERMTERESTIMYNINDKGCKLTANFSDNELREFVKSELYGSMDKKRFIKIIEKIQKEDFERENNYKQAQIESIKRENEEYFKKTGEKWTMGEDCDIAQKRVLETLNSME